MSNSESANEKARGAYETLDDAIRECARIRLENDRAASTSIWLAPGGGYFVAGARLGPPIEGTLDLRGSRRVFRFRRLRRGAPVEVLDERMPRSEQAWRPLAQVQEEPEPLPLALIEERPADCSGCGRTAWVTAEERIRGRWTCYGCGLGNRWERFVVDELGVHARRVGRIEDAGPPPRPERYVEGARDFHVFLDGQDERAAHVDLETVTPEVRAKLEAAGYRPVLRWKRSIGVGTSVTCTTDEALANVAEDERRRRA